MKDPWTWTTVWGLTMGVRVGLGGRGQKEKNWDDCNSINNKMFSKKIWSYPVNRPHTLAQVTMEVQRGIQDRDRQMRFITKYSARSSHGKK